MSAGAMIGIGHVWHRRLRPVINEFRYPGYFLLLPMRQLRDRPDAALARNRFAPLSFHDRDHGDGGPDALAWAEALLQREGIEVEGEIWLQTFPRVLGHTFKPVSFWWACAADGTLTAALAEVNNTFGDRHAYLLTGEALSRGGEATVAKVFHVSPFCRVEGHYRFRFERTDRHCRVHIDHHDAAGPLLQTCQAGALEPLTAAAARRVLLGMPFMTLAVLARIHWQALRLWLHRVPFFRRAPMPEQPVSR